MTTDHLELAYVGLEVADAGAMSGFLTDIVGLVPGEPTTDGHATFRNDGRVHRILVTQGPANDAAFVGLETPTAESFDRLLDRARSAGATVTQGSDSLRAARRVVDLAHIESPWGVPFELVRGLAESGSPFESSLVPGGFVTKSEGFGHVVFVVADLDEAHAFATEALGLAQSDWLETDVGGTALTVRFYHCNPRHHSLALGSVGIQPGLPEMMGTREPVIGPVSRGNGRGGVVGSCYYACR